MTIRSAFIAFALALPALACAAENSGALLAPQPGAPCGNTGVPCYAQAANGTIEFTHECCWTGSVCGGGALNVGCPADSCCEEGDETHKPGTPFTPRIVGKKWQSD